MQNDLDQVARLEFLQIDQATRSALQEFRPLLAQYIDPMLDAFYDHIRSTPAAMKIFTGHSMDHARKMQRTHWLDNVFSGRFDEAYFAQAVRIGKIHEKVGLEPRWYIGGYAASLARMSAIAAKIYHKQQDKLALITSSMQKAGKHSPSTTPKFRR